MNIQELIYALPSKKIFDNCAVLAVEHPKTQEIIILKNRFETAVIKPDLEFYNQRNNVNHDYGELRGKKVLYNWELLNPRGQNELLNHTLSTK